MSSSRMPYLFTILMGSLDPFPCLSEDEPPPEFDPRPEFRPDEDRGLFFCELDLEFDSLTENLTENQTEYETEN